MWTVWNGKQDNPGPCLSGVLQWPRMNCYHSPQENTLHIIIICIKGAIPVKNPSRIHQNNMTGNHTTVQLESNDNTLLFWLKHEIFISAKPSFFQVPFTAKIRVQINNRYSSKLIYMPRKWKWHQSEKEHLERNSGNTSHAHYSVRQKINDE